MPGHGFAVFGAARARLEGNGRKFTGAIVAIALEPDILELGILVSDVFESSIRQLATRHTGKTSAADSQIWGFADKVVEKTQAQTATRKSILASKMYIEDGFTKRSGMDANARMCKVSSISVFIGCRE